MKKLLLQLITILVLSSVLSAQAQTLTWQQQLLASCQTQIQSAGIPVIELVCSGQTPSASNVTGQYSPTTTQAQIATAQAIIAAFNWSTPQPNLVGFKLAVLGDPTIPAVAKTALLPFSGALTDLVPYSGQTTQLGTTTGAISPGNSVSVTITSTTGLQPGTFVMLSQGSTTEVTAIASVTNSTTLVLNNVANSYSPNASVTVLDLLQQAWFGIKVTNTTLQSAVCTDANSTPVFTKLEEWSNTYQLPLNPTMTTPAP